MNAIEIGNNAQVLEYLINRGLLDSLQWIYLGCAPKQPQEPDYVAALSLRFTERLFYILSAVFPHCQFSVSSVFCHQKPIVDIGKVKKPEVGDILLVYVDKQANGIIRYNSLLLQAKISNSPILKIHSSEQHQLDLYCDWPKFTYYRAGALNGQTRDIVPKTPTKGAQYLLIDNNPLTNGLCEQAGTFPMGCGLASNPVYLDESLSIELINFLKFKSGRPFEKKNSKTNDDWTKMIWDLLTISSNKFSKRKNAGNLKIPRCCIHKHSEFGQTLFDELALYQRNNDINESDDFGVTTILIESKTSQESQLEYYEQWQR